jgi:hypothetical protein
MMIASGVTGFGGTSFVPSIAQGVAEVKQTFPAENKKVPTDRNIMIEEYVRNYFSDIPVMVEIARCESRFRHYGSDGNVLRGEENSLDRGVMQINEFYHEATSSKLGYDIRTLEGNTSYARVLFEKYGVRPWVSSSKCWGKTVAYSEYEELALQK